MTVCRCSNENTDAVMSIWAGMTAGVRGRLKAGLCFQTTSLHTTATSST
ncbi:hypothetical protein [Neisseria sicca]|nr:hypothetical protein [Neisseria sicca]